MRAPDDIEGELVEKCQTCQFYDRRNSTSDGKGPSWGQCRRTAPALHPVNVKAYMIEGVWPHVRDDDWCGEWKIVPRRIDARLVGDAKSATLMASAATGARVTTLPAPMAAQGASD